MSKQRKGWMAEFRKADDQNTPTRGNLADREEGLRPGGSSEHGRRIWLAVTVLVGGSLVALIALVVFLVLGESAELRKERQARRGVVDLAQQADIYMIHNPEPASIRTLTQQQPNGGPPLVRPDQVIDPWGKPYQLDTTGVRAIVWTIAPDGTRIGSDDK